MNRAFYTILLAQFMSALADNALLFAAIGLLVFFAAPDWHSPLLQTVFVIAYIVLAPLVGAFADALPKGRVMLIANTVKFVGCIAMLGGLHPLLSYIIVGIGAAMYSPAKYGILTELLPPEKLVIANSWMEGATVAAIVLGAIIGGALINPLLAESTLQSLGMDGQLIAPKFAIVVTTGLYLGAAVINLFIPRLPIDHKPANNSPLFLLHDFGHSFMLLWRDPLGQVSLAVTTLFWGVGATLRLLIIEWAALNLKYSLGEATQLTAATAVGIALGSILAGKYVRLEHAIRTLPAGIVLGLIPISLIWVESLTLALILLILLGVLAAFFVVPMNALLQHRGHLLMGAGHSIAQQNFNENISILLLTGAYALMIRADWHIHTIVWVFGLFISSVMTAIWLRHRNDVVH
ncbi:lysophospholipid transporter LplT [Thiobacillus sp.]|uniref:lysophospholipid transporter LplT n=1 Tax=Thiobacillus sp. TaxID=924 RepID=UPI00286E4ED8|nr:lysophospholipid transporter LplT [Thiobacillus sp.]